MAGLPIKALPLPVMKTYAIPLPSTMSQARIKSHAPCFLSALLKIMNLLSLPKFQLGRSSGIDEELVQQFIERSPDGLNLGVKTRLLQKQRRHQGAGKLDLLLESEDRQTRYVVELMLGNLDESHIIRAIEYWDIERRAYPDISHVAVIIAKGLGRFLNVIGLLTGAGRIPVIVIQLSAFTANEQGDVAIVFSKVLDQSRLLVEDESEEDQPSQSQPWADRVPLAIMTAVKSIYGWMQEETDQTLELREVQQYIAVSPTGTRSTTFVFTPHVRSLQMAICIEQNAAMDELIQTIGNYDSRYGCYLLRILPADLDSLEEVFRSLGEILFAT